MAFYVRIRGRVFGPLEENQLLDMVRQGKLGRMNEISTDNRQWVRADEFEQFFPKHKPKHKQLFGHLELPKDEAAEDGLQAENSSGKTGGLSIKSSETDVWYYSEDGKTGLGPYPESDIVQMIKQGMIVGHTILWHEQLDPQKAETLAEFASYFKRSSKSLTKRAGRASRLQQEIKEKPERTGTVASEVFEQLERASTWALVLALVASVCVAMVLTSQLFLFVLVTQTGTVLWTLAFLMTALVIDLASGYMLYAFWRYVNQLRHAAHDTDEASLALAIRRMTEFWRACVIAPIFLFLYILLFTLLTFAMGLNTLKAFTKMMEEMPINMPSDFPVTVPTYPSNESVPEI